MGKIIRFATSNRLSQAVVVPNGAMVYLSGQVASDRSKAVREQTQEVLEKIDALLAETGTRRANIVSAMVWLADISDFDQMNDIWDSWVLPEQAPTRACVQALLAKPDILVEIQVTAQLSP